jgi:hypothetical protein
MPMPSNQARRVLELPLASRTVGWCADGNAGNQRASARRVQCQRQTVQGQRREGHRGGFGIDFMQADHDAEGAEEQQHRDIGQHAAVVARLSLPAKGERHRLRFRSASQPVGGIPERGGGQREPDNAGQARCLRIAQHAAQRMDEDGPDPERQRTFLGDPLADVVEHRFRRHRQNFVKIEISN